ncbi:Hypothetical predicted protein [Mytilus galloprovincialis]|uniref:ubiquitinyl hydrolase 1 n=1 Tax=Mytilus galloprovincialis TaxID=29158 RepID=A0A8B6CYU3_MYTGA|nr:Hypothetical predicted protein [Mytilus galloprovincialis]
MLWILQSALSQCFKFLLDCIFFIIVDLFVKWFLGDSRSPEEKKKIWLFESAALLISCVLIQLCDHTPYFLIGLTIVTFVYTQLPWLRFNPDLRHWWGVAQTRWEEYQQHSDSMARLQKQLSNEPPMRGMMNARPNIRHEEMRNNRFGPFQQKNVNFSFPQGQTQSNFEGMSNQSTNKKQSATTGKSMLSSLSRIKLSNVFKRQQNNATPLKPEFSFMPTSTPKVQHNDINTAIVTNENNSPPKSTWFGSQLTRQPIRKIDRPYTPNYSPDYSSSLRNKFMSTFGFSGHHSGPPGLRNEGQNLCFMNSILQCIARTPNLCKHLSLETAKEAECSVAESVLLNTLVEIMNSCMVDNSSSSLDPMAFRQAASTLNSSLVAAPSQRQVQQDAAEFFMWLMDTVHTLLNKNRRGGQVAVENPRLNMLKFIYGHLNPAKIQDLKNACQVEINAANGFQNETYAEPIQRLSDLEWLSYKQENDSVIDNLFTGQLVTAFHNLRDNKISVNLQTYNVLPVTIAEPRDVSGLVVLLDCFSNFCNIEHLSGQEEIDNSPYKTVESPISQQSNQNLHRTPSNLRERKFTSVDSAISVGSPYSVMSPIPGMANLNDSGYQDNVFRTSTPIGNSVNPSRVLSRTCSIQRRCLLRQLPECLVIQLMRFSYNQLTGQSRKLLSPVKIPLKTLDLTSIMFDTVTHQENLSEEENCYKYALYGVCVHYGGESTNYGHYVSYALQPDSSKWYKFDDEMVTEVNMDYELTTQEVMRNAYLLFYKKCKSN